MLETDGKVLFDTSKYLEILKQDLWLVVQWSKHILIGGKHQCWW